jgi:hypothetical protein
MWDALVSDVTAVAKDVVDLCGRSMDDSKQVYMSLPRPGVSLLSSFFKEVVEKLIVCPGWRPDTWTDWPPDRQS